jgi:hypothetical protein
LRDLGAAANGSAVELTELQQQAVQQALSSPVSVLCGGRRQPENHDTTRHPSGGRGLFRRELSDLPSRPRRPRREAHARNHRTRGDDNPSLPDRRTPRQTRTGRGPADRRRSLDGRPSHCVRRVASDLLGCACCCWAMSIHKAQGSAFQHVIVPIVSSKLLDRTLVYTALTRATRSVILSETCGYCVLPLSDRRKQWIVASGSLFELTTAERCAATSGGWGRSPSASSARLTTSGCFVSGHADARCPRIASPSPARYHACTVAAWTCQRSATPRTHSYSQVLNSVYANRRPHLSLCLLCPRKGPTRAFRFRAPLRAARAHAAVAVADVVAHADRQPRR